MRRRVPGKMNSSQPHIETTMKPAAGNSESYAIAFARPVYDWAEIKIVMRNLVRHLDYKDHIHSVDLMVKCSVSSTFEHVYGVKFALQSLNSEMNLAEIEAAAKVMRGIEKKLQKMQHELGYVTDENFPEFARRILVASGIRGVLYERTFNQGNVDRQGNQLKDGVFGLPHVDPRDGKDFLSVIRNLTDDTLAKKGKQKEVA
jgi:hypothetical protein